MEGKGGFLGLRERQGEGKEMERDEGKEKGWELRLKKEKEGKKGMEEARRGMDKKKEAGR